MALSTSEALLKNRKLPISWAGLPKCKYRRLRAILTRKRDVRNALIYREWIGADNKEASLRIIADRWEFQKASSIQRIIDTQRRKGVSVAQYASNIEGIRQVRAAQVAADNDVAQSELDGYLGALYAFRETGEEFLVQEITERDGDKASTTTVRIPIQKAINDALALKNSFYESEAKAMAHFEGVAANQKFKKGTAKVTIEADAEFLAEWARLRGKPDELLNRKEVQSA